MTRTPGYIQRAMYIGQHRDNTARPACTCNPAPWHDGDNPMNRHLDQLHGDNCAIIAERRKRLVP